MRRQPLGSRSSCNYLSLNPKPVTLQQMPARPFVGGPSGVLNSVLPLTSIANAFSLVAQAASLMSDAGPLSIPTHITVNLCKYVLQLAVQLPVD
jgi:hypothetical protein